MSKTRRFNLFSLLRDTENKRYVFGIGDDESTLWKDTNCHCIFLYDKEMSYIGSVKVFDNGMIKDLEVYENFRFQGYGKFLLELAVSVFNGDKIRCPQDDIIENSFYKKMGFKKNISPYNCELFYILGNDDFKPVYDLQNQNIKVDDVDIPDLKVSNDLTSSYLFKLD